MYTVCSSTLFKKRIDYISEKVFKRIIWNYQIKVMLARQLLFMCVISTLWKDCLISTCKVLMFCWLFAFFSTAKKSILDEIIIFSVHFHFQKLVTLVASILYITYIRQKVSIINSYKEFYSNNWTTHWK
jgi:hypothetical protein